MICPSNACKADIPEDSCYCDQCGLQLSKCDKCGAIGASKRCGKCGGFMVPITVVPTPSAAPAASTPVQPAAAPQPVASTVSFVPGGTIVMGAPAALELVHAEGWSLVLADGNIFGRVTGNYVNQLGKFATISSRHAQVSLNNGSWFITDLGSTNGTLINGNRIAPNSPVEINENDTVVFADVSFTVRSK